ncbi:ABC transporter substrate-binding protein [Alteromonas portus]|uniref:ABC transporter substrate-binding protein n=1 Tax=Alteromonas portus TaxID=2565549 RepID=UPI003BF85491
MLKVWFSFFFAFVFSVANLSSAQAKEALDLVILETLPVPIVAESRAEFEKELIRIMPDHDFKVTTYNAEGSEVRAKEILTELALEPAPDLIVSVATLATRALNASEEFIDTPKLFMVVSAPVEEGIVPAIGATSKRNMTGESHVLDAKVKLDMLDGVLRASKPTSPFTIGLVHSTYPSSSNLVNQLLALDSDYENINLVAVSTPYLEGNEGRVEMTDNIVDSLNQKRSELDGYWLSSGPLAEANGLVEKVKETSGLLPLFAESISSVKDGALIGVVSEPASIGKSAARKAKLILEKKSARDIPVGKMDTYTVAVNVTTAIKLQLPIPSSYLKLSKEHVYH